MNMDKVIKVACVHTQVEDDLKDLYSNSVETQSNLTLMGKEYNLIMDS